MSISDKTVINWYDNNHSDRAMPTTPTPKLQGQISEIISQFQSENLRSALASAERLAKEHPDIPILFNIIGAIQTQMGKLSEAVKSYQYSLVLDPNYAEAHNNLGNALRALKQPTEALAAYQQAFTLKPDLLDARHNAALLLHELNQYDSAIQAWQDLLVRDSELPDAQRNLGRLLLKQNRKPEALSHFSKALEITPKDAETLNLCGSILLEQNHLESAAEMFREALQADPDCIDAIYNLGVIAQSEGRHEAAIDFYNQALTIAPEFVPALTNAGVVSTDLGNPSDARNYYTTALRANPAAGKLHYNLAQLTEYTPENPHLLQMKAQITHSGQSTENKEFISFALAKALNDCGEYEAAFAALATANQLHKSSFPYSLTTDKALFDAIRQTYETITGFEPAPSQGPNKTPIFILGLPRSGTTLVEQILASHPDVYGAGELTCLDQAINAKTTSAPRMPWAEQSLTLSFAPLSTMRESYQTAINRLGESERFITDKMPLNFRWIGFIAQALPDARIIHVVRDPVATCWSMFRHRFDGIGNGFAYDLQDLAGYYRLYQSLMSFWEERLSGRVLNVSYENLTENQETATRNILDYCALDWNDACLDFHNTRRVIKTASSQQVRRKIYQGSSKAWKPYSEFLTPLTSLTSG